MYRAHGREHGNYYNGASRRTFTWKMKWKLWADSGYRSEKFFIIMDQNPYVTLYNPQKAHGVNGTNLSTRDLTLDLGAPSQLERTQLAQILDLNKSQLKASVA